MEKEPINFDNLTAEQVGNLFPIRIVPYNPDWKKLFEQEKVLITGVLGEDIVLNVEHFGSTGVEGLVAKPTIDILVEVSQLSDVLKKIISRKLETIGYGNMRNANQENKMIFGKGYNNNKNRICSQTYHLHIREKGNIPQDEIYFRDCLQQNPDVRNEYAKLKYELAKKYQFNREDYTNAKTGFIIKITEQQKNKTMSKKMKTLEESIAAAMDAQQDTTIIPFLPYIFQDFWELGTPPEIVINLVQKHCKNYTTLHVLDLGCGKGAVSIKLAAALKCNCYGIDGIPEFIEVAKEKAKEYGVDTLCRFEVGDVRKKIEELDKFDVIVLGATGPIFGDYYTALTALSKHLTGVGIIIIEEAYIDDTSTFQHPPILRRKELVNQFVRANMKLIDEYIGQYSEWMDSSKDMEMMLIRCNELKTKYPEKSSVFEKYIQNQASEYDVLENQMIGSAMVLKTKFRE